MSTPDWARWRVVVLAPGRFYAYPRRRAAGQVAEPAVFASHPAAVRYACGAAYLNYLYTRKGAMRP